MYRPAIMIVIVIFTAVLGIGVTALALLWRVKRYNRSQFRTLVQYFG